MAISIEQIVEEMRNWTPDQMGRMIDQLTQELHASNPEAESAWLLEINRRATIPPSPSVAADSRLLKHRQRGGLW